MVHSDRTNKWWSFSQTVGLPGTDSARPAEHITADDTFHHRQVEELQHLNTPQSGLVWTPKHLRAQQLLPTSSLKIFMCLGLMVLFTLWSRWLLLHHYTNLSYTQTPASLSQLTTLHERADKLTCIQRSFFHSRWGWRQDLCTATTNLLFRWAFWNRNIIHTCMIL